MFMQCARMHFHTRARTHQLAALLTANYSCACSAHMRAYTHTRHTSLQHFLHHGNGAFRENSVFGEQFMTAAQLTETWQQANPQTLLPAASGCVPNRIHSYFYAIPLSSFFIFSRFPLCVVRLQAQNSIDVLACIIHPEDRTEFLSLASALVIT